MITEKNRKRIFNKTELTNREKEILKLVKQGKTKQEIADILIVSFNTVKTIRHNINIKKKLKEELSKMDNPRFVKKYHTPNADGQIPINCVCFNYMENPDFSDTCSVQTDYRKGILKLVPCEVVFGRYCDCYRNGR